MWCVLSRNSQPLAGIRLIVSSDCYSQASPLRPVTTARLYFSHLSLCFSLFSMSRSFNGNNAPIPNNNGTISTPNNPGINTNNMDHWRVAVLGDGGVGKTALAVQTQLAVSPVTYTFFLTCVYDISETYDPTIEDAYRKQLVVDNRMCFVEVIDTAGQEEYATLRDQWVREGQAFILVYSIASRTTFERLEMFRQSMRRVKRGDTIFMLVGNKCDKTYEREVSKEEGAALARQFGCEFLETSAKTAQNVERLFTNLVRALRDAHAAKEEGQQVPKRKKNKKCIVF
ncbi:hypothetical protein D9756_004230 [Leucocoprinus leucothites]|uniref:Ras protein n=1 Tax=Leucocoprinus leucothites TaxID=201217 RepID=A0A8H5G115_9AGAR|nr:hypothetical protein D9756_004230 [Leucoagaricus leucothites]